ncbi:MAG: LysR family transcriptional regulator [Roseibium sp.]|uniref:LysR family transcriptional regulator n=1 Tax=Roseibium sp. TaxID=1936156 RepID=UPI002630F9F3|nr:LysR family transcriptional regulator [Roseibium sp.]MCV0429663.1 LysR family transcriptional regulator [Roseibium sp.]
MKLQQLRFFVAVYEEGSFSAAANRVHATQSGISMQVRELEDRYGVQLLTRKSTGVSPTEAGRLFYAKAIEVLRAAATADELLKRVSGTMTGQIRIGLIPTLTRSVLSEAMLRFTDTYPMVHLSLVEAYSFQLIDAVGREELDFAVVPAFEGHENIRSEPMGTDQEFLVGAPGNGHLQSIELQGHPPLRYVLPSPANSRRRRIDRYFAAHHIQTESVLELDAMFGTIDLVARSDWHTILPGIMCAADLDGQRRRLHPISNPELSVSYSRIEPAAKPLNQAAQAFSDILQEELTNTLAATRAATRCED